MLLDLLFHHMLWINHNTGEVIVPPEPARPRRPWVVPAQFIKVPSRRRDEEALLLTGGL